MRQQFRYVVLLLQRLGIVLLLYTCCRLLFFLFNYTLFAEAGWLEISKTFVYGLRFDLSAIIYINSLFILLHLLPHPFRARRSYQKTLKGLFYLTNGATLFLAITDLVYFQFTFKRSTTHLVGFKEDILHLVPQLLQNYGYLLLIWAGLLVLAEWLYRKTERPRSEVPVHYVIQTVLLLVFSGLAVVGARGGLQLRPISPLTAHTHTHAHLAPMITNTPFTFLLSLDRQSLAPRNYFPSENCDRHYPVYRQQHPQQPLRTDNIVIIVLESFSHEYIGALNRWNGHTPFLDSLIQQGLVFSNAYASSRASHEGIVAITGGIPALMEIPFNFSVYQDNRFKGLGTLLKKQGYATAFFHGGKTGTMGLDGFVRAAGFSDYYGMEDYPDKSQYDGVWGIFDEPFFQFFAHALDRLPQPFCTGFFSLSSHQPHVIPEQHADRFKQHSRPLLSTIAYTDFALRRFFETARQKSWFKNTLFIITADHTGPIVHTESKGRTGRFAVPILLYKPGSNLSGRITRPVQHTDILPTVLDYINFKGCFTAFGYSMLDTTAPKYAFHLQDGLYQLIADDYMLLFDGREVTGVYDYRQDPLQKHSLEGEVPVARVQQLERTLKAVIQQYHHKLRQNALMPVCDTLSPGDPAGKAQQFVKKDLQKSSQINDGH